MAGDKVTVSFEINEDMEELLADAVEKYELEDASKALRCLLDYAREDGDWDEIFGTVRCLRCDD